MSERLHFFQTTQQRTAVALPFDLDAVLQAWVALRHVMVKNLPAAFTRDEWAYLISFLDASTLMAPFVDAFGEPAPAPARPVGRLARPRGTIAVWLPSNVSLLGPLTFVLLSLTGNGLRMKEGSQSQNLTQTFLDFVRAHVQDGPLAAFLRDQVQLEQFDRDDPRNHDMAAAASVRIVFGSDDAVAAVDALPHPPGSIGFAFSDRQSEAWLEPAAVDDTTLTTLIKVFAIYGQVGCTSPRKLVLLDSDRTQACLLRDRLIALWPRVMPQRPAMHIASANVMARQLAAAYGWDVAATPDNGAVFAAGDATLPALSGPMTLPIVASGVDEALARLPANVQTVGHALTHPDDPRWLACLAQSRIKRFVPIAQMHHFGPTWDGWPFWRQTFEEVEVCQ